MLQVPQFYSEDTRIALMTAHPKMMIFKNENEIQLTNIKNVAKRIL